MNYWLVKTEPETFSWDDLKASPKKTTSWEGVRNYQARNYMRDQMKKGDLVFFYHSVVKPLSIVGIAKVAREAYPDHYAHDPKNKYYDPKSSPDNPRWFMVDLQAVKGIAPPVTLDELKQTRGLEKMVLLQKGGRLSVQPVTAKEWKIVLGLRRMKI